MIHKTLHFAIYRILPYQTILGTRTVELYVKDLYFHSNLKFKYQHNQIHVGFVIYGFYGIYIFVYGPLFTKNFETV